ncbi:MAG: YbaB/EbfC family nucleoid-associated protein [Deltaproteobacteria bacterium]|nr:MAG: YbaB/EbfC family nucleoid-associated protein [Deltaproteobacteria bacterium]
MTDLDLGTLMQKAQELKAQMEYIQKGLAERTVEGSAGAGMVKVTATGTGRIQKIEIDPQVLSEDREMIEDLVTAAVNQALDKSRALAQETVGSMLPPGFPMPGGG